MSFTERGKLSNVETLEHVPDRKNLGDEVGSKSPEEKALVRKIDLYLMPTIWILYLLAVRHSFSLTNPD